MELFLYLKCIFHKFSAVFTFTFLKVLKASFHCSTHSPSISQFVQTFKMKVLFLIVSCLALVSMATAQLECRSCKQFLDVYIKSRYDCICNTRMFTKTTKMFTTSDGFKYSSFCCKVKIPS